MLGELLDWRRDYDELGPNLWASTECPGCGETELASNFMGPTSRFVCMRCGCLARIHRDGAAEFWT